MDIYINGTKINFELENENNVFQIIDAIADFSANAVPKQFITGIYIDEVEVSFADDFKLKKIGFDSFSKLEIETSDIYGITELSLNQIEKFIYFIGEIFEGDKWDNSFLKISDSMDWMKDGINQIYNIFGTGNDNIKNERKVFFGIYENLKEFLINLNSKNFPLNDELKNQALEMKKALQASFNIIKLGITKPQKMFDKNNILSNIEKLLADIEDLLPKLSNIPILFQTGGDQEAMFTIQKLAGILEGCISLFVVFKENFNTYFDKYSVKELSFEDFFHVISEQLKELMSGIENNDTVMISDLLEYEFVPNLEEIRNILVKIKKEAFDKAN